MALTSDHDELRACDGLVLPGVGAFPKAMHNLRAAISSLAKHQDRTFTTRSVAIRVWRLT